MGFFSLSPKQNNDTNSDEKHLEAFERHKGRLTQREIEQHLRRIPLRSNQREYIKAVIAKFDNPYEPPSKRFVTEEEFLQGLDEMAKNNRDSISSDEVERIKKYFSK